MVVVSFEHFEPQAVKIGEVKNVDIGKKGTKIKLIGLGYYTSNERIYLQSPDNLSLPFGISESDMDPSNIKYSIDARCETSMSEEAAAFVSKIKELEKFVLDTAVERSVEWFGSKKSRDVLEEKFISCIKHKDPKYDPILRAKVKNETKFFDKDQNELAIDDIVKNSKLCIILGMPMIYFSAGSFGISCKAEQVMVTHMPNTMKDFAFIQAPGKDIEDGTPAFI